jgi:predicted NBD/HSP70 family sugar kinase
MLKTYEKISIQPGRAVARQSPQLAVPADMRINNLLCVLAELRNAEMLSRSDLARLTNLGVPTVHRLIGDLLATELVEEIPARQDQVQKGRPAVFYRLNEHAVLLAGVDIGNETTRFALASATGRILAFQTKRTSGLQRRLVEAIAEEIESLLDSLGIQRSQLAGTAIGVAAVVDPITGILRSPPKHRNLQDLPLGVLVEARLGCPVIVRQDDHFAAIAEASSSGTFPGADSLVVLEIGTGIGAAMIVNGVTVMGARGRFGRIAGWPVSTPRRGVAKSTLGQSLVAGGLVDDYHRRGGAAQVFDGQTLFAAAQDGDPVADLVLAWAGREIAELVIRLHRFCDPAAIVLGGELARGFAILEPHLRPHLPSEINLAASKLGEYTVMIGAILSCLDFCETFVIRQLAEADSESRSPRSVFLKRVMT